MGKAAGPTGVVSEMMKTSGGLGSRWMTDMINNIVWGPREGACLMAVPAMSTRPRDDFHPSRHQKR